MGGTGNRLVCVIMTDCVRKSICDSPLSLPFQEKMPNLTKLSKEQFSLVEQEVLEMLEKAAIQNVVPTHGQFLSKLSLVEKKDRGNRPVIN